MQFTSAKFMRLSKNKFKSEAEAHATIHNLGGGANPPPQDMHTLTWGINGSVFTS